MEQNTNTPRVSPFMALIFKIEGIAEIVALVATAIGVYMLYAKHPAAILVLNPSMSVLAAVFFLRAYQPVDGPPPIKDEERPKGFAALLGQTIAPKVSWISSAINVVGIQFYLMGLKGAGEMLLIGVTAGAVAVALVGLFVATNNRWIPTFMPMFYRVIPTWLAALYLFIDKPVI